MIFKVTLSIFLIAVFSVSSATQNQPDFGLPVKCEMGQECFIQNYVDHDQSVAYQDFRCGHLSYDGHKGTDFRVKTQTQMELGVPVLAAADGKVIGVRDGEPDIAVSIRGKENLRGKEAGNGVVIDHGNYWTTQYSHLKRGSVKVQMGQIVKKGQILGFIGESGNADFPHLDFAVRYRNQIIDPFLPDNPQGCVSMGEVESLWDASTKKLLSYQPTGVLAYGFSTAIPSRLEIDQGAGISPIYIDDPALIFWVEIFGANNGDNWDIEIRGPLDKRLVQAHQTQVGDKAVAIFAAGIKISQPKFQPGLYRAQFRLIRGDKIIFEQSAQTQINIR